MKGFFINVGLSHLEKTYDDLSIEDLLSFETAPPGGVYSPMVDYPDTTLRDLVERAALLIGIPQKKLSKLIGVFVFSELISMNLNWIQEFGSTFELLKNHDEYLKKYLKKNFF